MRSCPICDGERRDVVDPDYQSFKLCACQDCGMHYADRDDASREGFDDYYANIYTTADKPYSDQRLNDLADYIVRLKPANVLDIGGMDGELQKRIIDRGLACDVDGVQAEKTGQYGLVVLSHTLEHIYDVPVMMKRIRSHLAGKLVVEGPIWFNYDNLRYDNHWQHANKFRPKDLESLMERNGFSILQSTQIPDYLEYKCWRLVAMHE